MTVLQALNSYYVRMAARGEVPEFGFTFENVSFALSLEADGSIRDVNDLRTSEHGKARPKRLVVPRPKRTSNIQSNFLWDKTAYVFGVDDGKSKRLSREHDEFKRLHRDLLSNLDLEHAKSLLAFLDRWTPAQFSEAPFTPDMVNQSFVFRLRDEHRYFHEIPALRQIWLSNLEEPDAPTGLCLVTGKYGTIETGHPVIKGVDNGQTSGSYLVSFNSSAYTSYGKPEDATNAPTSKAAAFQYGAALNRLLDRSISRNRLKGRIGDATVVFWADSSGVGKEAAEAAEELFEVANGEKDDDDAGQAVKIRDALELVRKGRRIEELGLGLREGTKFYVLGLSPNAARLSIRYWLADDFSVFIRHLAEHDGDLRLEPPPFRWGNTLPSVQRLLVRTTALQEKFDNIPKLLAGETIRAVLTGERYPRTLLMAALGRLRAGDDPGSGWHAAVIKAVLARDLRKTGSKERVPMSLDRENPDPAYHLGRLFAAMETAQRLAIPGVNATIRDRYFGAASAAPATIFPLLLRGVQNHLGKLRKDHKSGWLEREIDEISSHVRTFPPTLPLKKQGLFVLGYYHQRQGQFAKKNAQHDLEKMEKGEDGDVND